MVKTEPLNSGSLVGILKVITSGPVLELAHTSACRSEPNPLSFVFVTGLQALGAIGTPENSEVLPAVSVAVAVMKS